MSNILLTLHVILPNLLQHYKLIWHVEIPISVLPPAMASTTSKRSTTDVAPVPAAERWRGKRNLPIVQKEMRLHDASSSPAYSDICTYWSVNPTFDPLRGLLRRLFS